jgi:hypothetical protein
MQKGMALAYFKHFPGGTDENQENLCQLPDISGKIKFRIFQM